MEQKGNNNNNVQIGNAGSGNTFNWTQSQNHSQPIQLRADSQQSYTIPKNKIRKNALQSLTISFSMMLTSLVSIASDSFGLAEKIGLSAKWLLLVTIPLTFFPLWNHQEDIRLFRSRPKRAGEANYAGNGELIEDDGDRSCLIHKPVGQCSYPHCLGKVNLADAPARERERLGKNFVGICSIAGRDHSYRVDYNWVAYPENLDWRPPENK